MVRRPGGRGVGSLRDELLAAADPPQTLLPHQAFDGAAGSNDALAGQQPPHLADATDAPTKLPVPEHPLDLDDQPLITDRASGREPLLERVVPGWGDLDLVRGEHAAVRLDPEPGTMIVDELNYHGSRGSSYRAKNEDAADKLSLTRFSSRT